MKEIKEFIQELCDCAKPSANGSVVALEDATRIVAHAFAAEFTYKGHSYIWFHNNNGGWDGIVHNPDCKCNKKIKSTTQY